MARVSVPLSVVAIALLGVVGMDARPAAVAQEVSPAAGMSDPSSGLLIVEAGAFTVRADTPLSVTRGEGLLGAMATVEATGGFAAALEAVAAGEDVTLEAGDAAFIPGSTEGEIRNDGQERAVGLGVLAAPPEGTGAGATPAP